MEKFTASQCEEDYWPGELVPPSIHVRMAEAAYAVLMVSAESASYTKEEEA